MSGERVARSEWLHIAAADRRRHWLSDDMHQLRVRDTKTMAASRRDCDVQFEYCLRVDPWRLEPDSSRDHMARDYQRVNFWWRIFLVFLF
jgi:hypothetical protein